MRSGAPSLHLWNAQARDPPTRLSPDSVENTRRSSWNNIVWPRKMEAPPKSLVSFHLFLSVRYLKWGCSASLLKKKKRDFRGRLKIKEQNRTPSYISVMFTKVLRIYFETTFGKTGDWDFAKNWIQLILLFREIIQLFLAISPRITQFHR